MPTITLNLSYDLNEEQWTAVNKVFAGMDGWIGTAENDNAPQWYGTTSAQKYNCASVEPSGLLIDGNINEPLFQRLIPSVCFVVSLDVLLVTGTGCRRTRVKFCPFFAR